MPKILIVEDNADTQLYLSRVLESIGAPYAVVGSAEEALKFLEAQATILILLDVQLPKKDGLQFFGELQANPKLRNIGVLFITADSQPMSKLAAFSLGAEDYIVKPFEPIELRARIESRLKKAAAKQHASLEISLENLTIDPGAQRVLIKEESGALTEVNLSSKEFKILLFLARNPDKVITRAAIIEKFWSGDQDVYDRTIDTHIYSIRKKLGAGAKFIQSVPGSGYRFSKTGSNAKRAA